MRFLQLKEAETGMVFSQPVLDTLLLSAVLHANQDSHQLEPIAERLGVTIPPATAPIKPAMIGAPDAKAMPSESGTATRKTTSEAGRSRRRVFIKLTTLPIPLPLTYPFLRGFYLTCLR